MKNRTSIIWKLKDRDFIDLIQKSKTMSEVLRFFGMENKGGNYQTCKKRIKELNLNISHFLGRLESYKHHNCVKKEDFILKLTEHSNYSRGNIKKFLIQFNLKKYECEQCKNNGDWQGKKLSLQLEHKNGISDDNRLENLSFLCPNCHSQTDTFAGKRHKKPKKIFFCIQCGDIYKGKSPNNICIKCSGINHRKQIRPSKEQLELLLKQKNVLQISKDFNVSQNTIRKWATSYQLNTKELSPFSRFNKKKKERIITFIPKSKYLNVSFDKSRNKWNAHVKESITKKSLFFKRCNSELEAAQEVANFKNSTELILR